LHEEESEAKAQAGARSRTVGDSRKLEERDQARNRKAAPANRLVETGPGWAMRLFHVFMAAAVGWYLMAPPFSRDTHEPINDAPLSKWSFDSGYDSAAECQGAKAAKTKSLSAKFAKASPAPHNPFRMHSGTAELARFLYMQILSARCVATDDPRLKAD
jgi:hypothetical protein